MISYEYIYWSMFKILKKYCLGAEISNWLTLPVRDCTRMRSSGFNIASAPYICVFSGLTKSGRVEFM